ncbi:MAG: hypothetical protein B6D55_06520, partial [Candidatus Omnitrophica bacterium 4484_70.2]
RVYKDEEQRRKIRYNAFRTGLLNCNVVTKQARGLISIWQRLLKKKETIYKEQKKAIEKLISSLDDKEVIDEILYKGRNSAAHFYFNVKIPQGDVMKKEAENPGLAGFRDTLKDLIYKGEYLQDNFHWYYKYIEKLLEGLEGSDEVMECFHKILFYKGIRLKRYFKFIEFLDQLIAAIGKRKAEISSSQAKASLITPFSSSPLRNWHLTKARMAFKEEVINFLISQKGEIEDIEKEIIGRILTFPTQRKTARWKYERLKITGLLGKEDVDILYSLKEKEEVKEKIKEFAIERFYKRLKREIEKMRKKDIEESDILNLLSRGYTLNYIKEIALKKGRDFRDIIRYLRDECGRLRIVRLEFEKKFNEPIRKGIIEPSPFYSKKATFSIGEVYFYLSLHYSKYAQDIKEGNLVYEYWWNKLIIKNKRTGKEWVFKINLDGYLLDLEGKIIKIKGKTTHKFVGRKREDKVTFNIGKLIPEWQDKRLMEEEKLKERIKNLWENASGRTPESARKSLQKVKKEICAFYPQLKGNFLEVARYIAEIINEKFLINYLKEEHSQRKIKEIFSIFFSKKRELIDKKVILSLNSLDEKSCVLILDMIKETVERREKIEKLKRELKNAFSRNFKRYKEEILLRREYIRDKKKEIIELLMRRISEEKRKIEKLREELENTFSRNLEKNRKEELWKVSKRLYNEIKESYKKSKNSDDLSKVLSKISIEKILLRSEFLPKKAIGIARIRREYIEHLFRIIELITEERWEEAVVSVYDFTERIYSIFPSSLEKDHPLLFKLLPENIKRRLPAENMEEDIVAVIERSLLFFGILASSIEELKKGLQSLCEPEKNYHLIKKAYKNKPPDRVAFNSMLALAIEENCQQKFKSALEELFKKKPESKNFIEEIIDACGTLPYKVEHIFKQVLENKSSSPISEFIKRKIRSPTIIILTLLLIVPSISYPFSCRLPFSIYQKAYNIDLEDRIIFRFDDGPCRQTPKILSLLEKHKIKNAQFYFIGRNFSPSYITREVEKALRSNSKGKVKRVILKLAKESCRGFSVEKARIIKRVIEDGYTLGIHTFTHPIKDKLKKYSPLQFLLEVVATQQAINLSLEKIGEKPYFCRVFATPGGEKNLPPILREQLKNLYKPSHPLSVYRLLGIKSLKQIFPHISELDSVRLEILGGLNQAERWNIDSCDTRVDKKRLKSREILKEIIKLSSYHQKITILIHPFKGGWQKQLKELFQLAQDRSSSSMKGEETFNEENILPEGYKKDSFSVAKVFQIKIPSYRFEAIMRSTLPLPYWGHYLFELREEGKNEMVGEIEMLINFKKKKIILKALEIFRSYRGKGLSKYLFASFLKILESYFKEYKFEKIDIFYNPLLAKIFVDFGFSPSKEEISIYLGRKKQEEKICIYLPTISRKKIVLPPEHPFKFLRGKPPSYDKFFIGTYYILNNREKMEKELEKIKVEISLSREEIKSFLFREGRNLERDYYAMLNQLITLLSFMDPYTRRHCERVAYYSKNIAFFLNLSFMERIAIDIGGLFHDIGKIRISPRIILKEGTLTPQEREIINTHPEKGVGILKKIGIDFEIIFNALTKAQKDENKEEFTKMIISSIQYHHESYQGDGYPSGLKGEEIPFSARIIAVADIFDALTSSRPYREGFSLEEVIGWLEASQRLDPHIKEIFLEAIRKGTILFNPWIVDKFWLVEKKTSSAMVENNKSELLKFYKTSAFVPLVEELQKEIEIYGITSSSYFFLKEFNQAIIYFQHAIKLSPDISYYFNLAIVYYVIGRFDLARRYFEEVKRINPDSILKDEIDEYLKKIEKISSSAILQKALIAYLSKHKKFLPFLEKKLVSLGYEVKTRKISSLVEFSQNKERFSLLLIISEGDENFIDLGERIFPSYFVLPSLYTFAFQERSKALQMRRLKKINWKNLLSRNAYIILGACRTGNKLASFLSQIINQ